MLISFLSRPLIIIIYLFNIDHHKFCFMMSSTYKITTRKYHPLNLMIFYFFHRFFFVLMEEAIKIIIKKLFYFYFLFFRYIFTIVSYLIGVFIFATIVGQVGNVITNRNANRLEFERLLDGAKTYMRHHKVIEFCWLVL